MSSGSETFVADSQSSFHGPTSNTSPRRNEHVLRLLRHLQAEQDKQRDLLKEVRELTIQCLREHNKEAVQMRNVIEELGVKQGTVITTPSIEIETTSDSFTKAADETQRFKERTVLTRWWTTFVFWIQGLFVFQNWKAAFSQPSPPAGVKPALDRPQEVSRRSNFHASSDLSAPEVSFLHKRSSYTSTSRDAEEPTIIDSELDDARLDDQLWLRFLSCCEIYLGLIGLNLLVFYGLP